MDSGSAVVQFQTMKVAAALLMMLMTIPAVGATRAKPTSSEDAQFRHWLVRYLKDDTPDDDLRNLVYGYALVDLNGDGRNEGMVWAQDNSNCGTGGCDLFIFVHRGPRWKLFSTVPVTRPPIEVLPSRTHGWHDIGVWSAGGGIERPYKRRIRFNGRKYPFAWSDAKVLPHTHAKVVIEEAAIPLFPTRCRRAQEAPSVFGPMPIKSAKPGTC